MELSDVKNRIIKGMKCDGRTSLQNQEDVK